MEKRRATTTGWAHPRAAWLLAAACVAAHTGARAAGHFDIDDAGTLEPGQCQYEAWWGRSTGPEPANVVHLGPACRVGAVELGLNLERLSVQRAHTVAVGPQLKWNFHGPAADAPLSAALSVGLTFDATRGGRAGGQLMLPLTWRPAENLQLHANLGADWATGIGARTPRGGLAAEWAIDEKLSLIAERSRAASAWTSRIGGRFSLTPFLSIDISASRTAQGVRSVVVGLNHAFAVK